VTRFALQHRTTKRFITVAPSLGTIQESADEKDAKSWVLMSEAEGQRLFLEAFADCYKVVSIRVADVPAGATP